MEKKEGGGGILVSQLIEGRKLIAFFLSDYIITIIKLIASCL